MVYEVPAVPVIPRSVNVAAPVVVSTAAVVVPTNKPLPLICVIAAVTVAVYEVTTRFCAFASETTGCVVKAAPEALPDEYVVRINLVGVAPKVTDAADACDAGPVFPARSVTPFAPRRATTVPSELHDTDTVNVVPLLASGVNVHEEAVPPLEKSEDERPVTDSDIVNVRSKLRTMYDVADDVNEETVGNVLSIVIAVVDAMDRLPARSTAYA